MPITGCAIPTTNDVLVLAAAIQEILRRGVDGTTLPVFVDPVNQRVVIGGTSVSASPAKIEVAAGDLKVVSAGSGVILSNRAGTQFYRLLIENDGTISADAL